MSSTHVPGARGPRCLIFDSDGVVRRVWAFPDTWLQLSDDELWALLDGASPCAPPPLAQATQSTEPRRCEPRIAQALATALQARMTVGAVHLALEHNRLLRQEQRELLAECDRVRTELRRAIESFAAQLRTEGVPPERALVLLKSAMQQGLRAPLSLEEPGADELVREGVGWGIAAYFAA